MDINKKYEQWLNYEGMDASLKAELVGMTEEQKEDAFYKNLEFGTAGMRGILGAGTNRMNIYTVRKANMGFAKYVANLPEGKERGVAISMIIDICHIVLQLNLQRFSQSLVLSLISWNL